MAAVLSLGRLVITYVALSILVLDPQNPRRHSLRQIRQIVRSIEAFGFAVPILVDCHNRILAGHGRYLAAQLLGLAEVPIIRLEQLTEAQAKAFRIADSRLTEMSDWNERLLAETLKELSQTQLDFSIESTGFTIGEIDLRIEGLNSDPNDSDDKADALPLQAIKEPVSRVEDLWLLGNHRVYCGNALDAHAYETMMQGGRGAMSF